MYMSTHAAVGAAVGTLTRSSPVGFILGVLSHLILDRIPHHDYKRYTGAAFDGVGTLMIFLWLAGFPSHIIWAAVGAVLPDLEVIILYLRGRKGRYIFPSHSGLLRHPYLKLPMGFIIQLALFVLAVIIVHFSC